MQMIPSLALNPSNLERPWKQHYVGIMKVNHTNLWNFYSSAAFYIGACPDMLIFCSCGGKELFEAKCPIIALWNVCLPGICKCQGKSIKVLQYVDGSASWKTTLLCTNSEPNSCYKQKLLRLFHLRKICNFWWEDMF